MNKKEERKNNILIGAFKLFLSKEYADVVTADLEEITGVTRGAIYYKVKNKEGLYRAVIDKFVFEFLSNSIGREKKNLMMKNCQPNIFICFHLHVFTTKDSRKNIKK